MDALRGLRGCSACVKVGNGSVSVVLIQGRIQDFGKGQSR